ncbi:MAG: methylmalonyl Co-A mutase-associated GTPase MeaB [Moraxellaceae bacterium]|nr:MAG: methylmalonyl Co-A mutase-associated GTPase MeaB [Moraxellaceae bacterium]
MSTIDIDKLLQGNRRSLAKAITLTESSLETHRKQAQALLDSVLPHTGKSLRIGITGVPGVGKSTFIEAFGLHLISQGKKVAVLAVDPSSPITGGSILGDKTRMELLSQNDNAFIRPSPTSGSLGGVAQKTREALLLCEAAGYDITIIETVGVGQSEYQVSGMVDFFLVLMLPNAGDELQGIKKGILELADSIIVNKADGACELLARQAKIHYQNALHFVSHKQQWTPSVLTCSALEKRNIDEAWSLISGYFESEDLAEFRQNKRKHQDLEWMQSLIHELLDIRLNNDANCARKKTQLIQQVELGKMTPLKAATETINSFFTSNKPN